MINPGEQIELAITLNNMGSASILTDDVLFTCSDPFVTILNAESLLPVIPGEATAELSAPFVFSVSETCPDRHVLDFVLTVMEYKGEEFSLPLSFPVNRSELHFADAEYDDSAGNGNGLPEPGETLKLTLTLSNEGSADAENVIATIIPDASGWVVLSDASALFPEIPANGSLTQVSDTIQLTIDPDCPAPFFLNLPLEIQTGSATWTEYSLMLPIGSMGLSEDFESGAPGWTHDGYLDQWNLDSQRVHSGNQSAYSGDPETRQYQNGMNAYYLSPYFTLPFNAKLSFWRWYQVATYGSNGLYVEIEIGGEWQILDFIGSGGALESKLRELTSDWHEEEYDLSSYPAVTQTRIRFRFSSDSEPVEEGFYLDDILVESQGGPASTPEPTPTPSPTPTPEPPWLVSDSFPASGPELEWDYVYLQDEVIPMAPACPGWRWLCFPGGRHLWSRYCLWRKSGCFELFCGNLSLSSCRWSHQ